METHMLVDSARIPAIPKNQIQRTGPFYNASANLKLNPFVALDQKKLGNFYKRGAHEFSGSKILAAQASLPNLSSLQTIGFVGIGVGVIGALAGAGLGGFWSATRTCIFIPKHISPAYVIGGMLLGAAIVGGSYYMGYRIARKL